MQLKYLPNVKRRIVICYDNTPEHNIKYVTDTFKEMSELVGVPASKIEHIAYNQRYYMHKRNKNKFDSKFAVELFDDDDDDFE